MKNIYVVIVVDSDIDKRYAIYRSIKAGENIAVVLNTYNTGYCRLCETMKEAKALSNKLNIKFKQDGTGVDA